MFEIYTMVCESNDNVDLVLGVKKFVGLEGEISMTEQNFKFLNTAVPIFPVYKDIIKPKERWHVKVETSFLDEISGLSIIKLLALNIYDALTLKVRFVEVINDPT